MKYKRLKAAVLILLFLMAGAFYSTDRSQDFSVSDVSDSEALESEAEASGSVNESLGSSASGETSENSDASGTSESGSAVSETQSMLYVHVCGAVEEPGVYELPEGSIVQDAVSMAGGVKKKGAADYLNLAEKLEDGEKIYVPYEDELEDGSGAGILSGSGTVSSSADGSSPADSSSESGLVNINTATKEELETLSGIGDSRAQAIIDYRTENGSFASIEDIMLVSGIKEGAFAKIKDQITV